MLRETHAKSASYDARNDTLVLSAEEDCGSAGSRNAMLLLDSQGFLVGVDLDGASGQSSGMDRLVVLLGPFEAVHQTVQTKVHVAKDIVTVLGAKKAARGDEKSPYL
jgi:hypothetical protein